MSTAIYQTGSPIGTAFSSPFTIFGDSVDISFAALVGFLSSLMLFWILGIGMRDSVQTGVIVIGAIYIAKSLFDSFFADAQIMQKTVNLRPGVEQID